MNKRSIAFATICHIAKLGHPPELVMPALEAAIRDIVPYDKINFMWLDQQYNVVDMTEPELVVPPDVMCYYLEQFHNKRECEEIPSKYKLMTHLGTDRSAVLPKFQSGDLFNVILRPGDNRHYLRLAIRNGVQPVGIFYLLRTLGSRDFTAEEERQLALAAPWLAHALVARHCSPPHEGYVDGESGLITVDKKGKILSFSRCVREVLHRAAGVPVNLQTLSDPCLGWARNLSIHLTHSLMANGGKQASLIPVRTVQNSAGRFVLRAYWMESVVANAERHIAIQIQHQIPFSLKLLQSPRTRKLPPREQQACLLLTRGMSPAEIAKHMGISRNGVIYHVRSLYNRLGISCREELVDALQKPED